MDAATPLCMKHHEPLPVGRPHPKLGAIRSCSRTRHSSASKYSQSVLGKIYAKAARFGLCFTRSGIFWRGYFYDIGNCQDAPFLDAPQVSIARKISIFRVSPCSFIFSVRPDIWRVEQMTAKLNFVRQQGSKDASRNE